MRVHPESSLDRRPISERIVLGVADAEGVDHSELDPLYETIDPDALDVLFRPDVRGSISFTYQGHNVAVGSDGGVSVDGCELPTRPPLDDADAEDAGASASGP